MNSYAKIFKERYSSELDPEIEAEGEKAESWKRASLGDVSQYARVAIDRKTKNDDSR